MASFDFTVDTREMAHALHGVAPHVDGTTAAVVAMQGAVVVAERRAAAEICANVDRGFFSLILSQITQRMATYKSQMDARLLELGQQAAALIAIKGRMERDYQMIAARYTKLFRTLDATLASRLQELDRPLFAFAGRDMGQLGNRARSSQATVPVHQAETLPATQRISSSVVKARTTRAIEGMRRFICEASEQKTLLASVLADSSGPGGALAFLPTIYLEHDGARSTRPQWQFHYPAAREELVARLRSRVEPAVQDREASAWREVSREERERVQRAFLEFVARSDASPRVKKLMTDAVAVSLWRTLPEGE